MNSIYRKQESRQAASISLLLICLLVATLSLLQSCGGGQNPALDPSIEPGTQTGDGKDVGQPVPVKPDSPGLPVLPSPSQLPRNTSAADPQFFVQGSSYSGDLQWTRNVQSGVGSGTLIFEPDFTSGTDQGPAGLAYAAYTLRTFGQDNGSERISLTWDGPLLHKYDLFIGMANFGKDKWDWMKPYTNDANLTELQLGDKFPDYIAPDGTLYVVVMFTGHGASTLKGVLVGDPLIDFYMQANPTQAEESLDTVISAGASVYGDEISYYDYDFEGDGTWDLEYSESGTAQHLYSIKGIYHPTVRVRTKSGKLATDKMDVYVTSTNNIGPTALLHASVDNGPAPLNVVLDGSDSFDDDSPSSQIIKVEWDLDNDGTYERSTGTKFVLATTLIREGSNKLKMRVTDNDLAKSTASVTVNVDGGWSFNELPGSQASYNGDQVGLALIGPSKLPAIAYRPSGIAKVQFVEALDSLGSQWSQHYFVSVDGANQQSAALADVGGNPAVAYDIYGDANDGVHYARATNPQGSAWGAPVKLSDTPLNLLDLEVVNGKPAVAQAAQQSNAGLYYISAKDSTGAQWNAPQQLINSNFVDGLGVPTIVNRAGQPPQVLAGDLDTSYWHANTKVVTGADLSGSSFMAPEVLWDSYAYRTDWLYDNNYLLAMDSGSPAFSGLNFTSIPELNGGAALGATSLDTAFHSGAELSICTLDGKPVIIYTKFAVEDTGNGYVPTIVMLPALNEQATVWGVESVVAADFTSGATGLNAVTLDNGKPLLVYNDTTNNKMMIGLWVAP